MRTRLVHVLAVALAAALAGACTSSNPQIIGSKVSRTALDPAALEKHKALLAEAEAAWALRADVAKLKEAIAKWDAAVAIKPDDADTYTKLSRAQYLYGDGHLFFESEGSEAKMQEFLAAHEKGLAYAEQGLRAFSAEYEKRIETGVKVEDAITVLDRSAVPLMYWYDVNLGKWAKAKGIDETLKHKDRIFGIMSRVYELDPDYFYGAPDRYFGTYYAVAPAFAGGDVNKSKEYFEKSLKKAPNYLVTHVLIAELLAPKLQDRALFDREIKFVLETPANVIPEVEAEAIIEKKKAERLSKMVDDLF
jgi:tetratricopeptide (TPR) repeat protein